jgi:hypothetical protein
MLAVRPAAVVLSPRALIGVSLQKRTAYPMVDTHFGATEPGEKRLGPIRRCAILAPIFLGVVDPLHRVAGVKHVPTSGLVRMDFGAGRDVLADRMDAIDLAINNPRQRPAMPLASNHDNAAARIFDIAPVRAILFAVLGANGAPDLAAVDFHDAAKLGAIVNDTAQRLAELVKQHEGAFGVDLHVARHFEG